MAILHILEVLLEPRHLLLLLPRVALREEGPSLHLLLELLPIGVLRVNLNVDTLHCVESMLDVAHEILVTALVSKLLASLHLCLLLPTHHRLKVLDQVTKTGLVADIELHLGLSLLLLLLGKSMLILRIK